jgi:hypothetical protein
MQKIIHKQRRSGLTYVAELELLAEVYWTALESYRKQKQEVKTTVAQRAAKQKAAGNE